MSPEASLADRGTTALDLARAVIEIEAQAVAALGPRLGGDFLRALDLILRCKGRVVVSGIGKSGHIGRKLAATFASTGTPAMFVHAAEAAHGDLGMVTTQDVFVALSNSGSSPELMTIVPILKREGTPLIAITGSDRSALAQAADIHLDCRVEREACPLNLAPTSSTTAMLALGDALAIACLDARGFGPQDFARSHPGGALGRRLLTRVADVMRTGDAVPSVGLGASVMDAVHEISGKQLGMTAVLEEPAQVAVGEDAGEDARATRVSTVMTRTPLTIGADALAAHAAQLLDSGRKNQLLVVDAARRVVGALHMHDLMRAKVI